MDRAFGEASYSIASLFRDLQRQVLKKLLRERLTEITEMYQRVFDRQPAADAVPPAPLRADSDALARDRRGPLQLRPALGLQGRRSGLRADSRPRSRGADLESSAGRQGTGLQAHQDARPRGPALGRLSRISSNRCDVLASGVDLARELPFEPNLWTPQNVYFDGARVACSTQMAEQAASDPVAAKWVDEFLSLGEKLGIVVEAEKKKADERRARPGIASLVAELIDSRHVPDATYRLQLNRGFTFEAARELVPYFHDLGVSDIYTSPILQARPGSLHGYDICDHSRVSDELGGEPALLDLARALEARGMGLVFDVVPNHMAVGNVANPWWEDVLEHGASSRYADYFDIDWQPINPDLEYKVLLPILGDQYGKTLEAGQLRLSYGDGSFVITYYDTSLPIAPQTYILILSPQIDELTRRLGDDHEQLLEYRSILTALRHLPPRTGLAEERQAERYREVAIIKRRLADPGGGQRGGAIGDRVRRRSVQRPDRLLRELRRDRPPDHRAIVPAGVLAGRDGRDQLPSLLRHQRAGRHPHRGPARLRGHAPCDLRPARQDSTVRPAHRPPGRALHPGALFPGHSGALPARPDSSATWR